VFLLLVWVMGWGDWFVAPAGVASAVCRFQVTVGVPCLDVVCFYPVSWLELFSADVAVCGCGAHPGSPLLIDGVI
jgi:hypothetical protein